MNFNYSRVLLFFAVIGVIAFVILPSSFDLVTMYKRSYLFQKATEILDLIEVRYPGNARVMVERADVLYLRGRYDEADELLIKVTTHLPDDVAAWSQLVLTRRALLDRRRLQDALEGLHAANPRDTDAAFELISLYQWHQLPERAVEIFENLARIEPANIEHSIAAAELRVRLQQFDTAAILLKATIARFPDRREPVDYLAEVYVHLERPAEITSYYERLLARGAPDTYILSALTEQYLAASRIAEAEAAIAKAIALDPGDLALKFRLGEIYLLDRPALARNLFHGLVLAEPGNEKYIERYVASLAMNGEAGRALHAFKNAYRDDLEEGAYYEKLASLFLSVNQETIAVTAAPFLERSATTRERRYLLARLYAKQRRFEKALKIVDALVIDHPGVASYWQMRLETYHAAKMGKEFIAEAAIRFPTLPRDPVFLERLADAHEWEGQYELALVMADRLLKFDPSNAGYRQRRGYALLGMREFAAAAVEFDALLAENPDSAVYRSGIVEAARLMDDRALAERYLQRVFVSSRRTDSQSAVALAAIYEKQQRVDEAVGLYGAMESLYPRNADLFAQIGSAALGAGEKQRARDWFERSLELEPENPDALSGLADLYSDEAPGTSLEFLAKLEKRRSAEPDVVYRIAQTLDALGRPEAAVARYRQFLLIATDEMKAEAYRLRQIARSRYRTGESEKALAVLIGGQNRFPADKGIVNDIAELLIEEKRYDEAMLLLH